MKPIYVKIFAAAALMLTAGTIQAQTSRRSAARNRTQVQATDKNRARVQKANAATERVAAQPSRQQKTSGSRYVVRGAISHTTWNKDESSSVIFTSFPATLDEFKQAREQLGREPQGAVALQVMAFELYRRDREAGQAALQLVNTATNYNSTIYQLKEMMGKDAYYSRPYLAAALLQGATPDNAYTPSSPYTVKVRVSPTSRYQESQLLRGTVIYLQIDSQGWDTSWRGVEVVKPEGQDYYVVSNCPAMYTQCKQIKGTWTPLK